MSELTIQLPALHPAQRAVAQHPVRFKVLECGRRFGKTAMGIDQMIRRSITGRYVGWFAPTYKYLYPVWDQVCGIVQAFAKINKVERVIRMPNGGIMEFWSLEDPDSGRSRKYHDVIIDECGMISKLEYSWQAAISPTLTDYSGTATFLGTPKGRAYFHKLFMRGESGDKEWKSWRLKTVDNPFIPRSEIERARRELPTHVFAQEYEGIPADDGGNPFDLQAISACIEPLSSSPVACFGVDLAKSMDWTEVIGLDEHGRTCFHERWQSPWETTLRRLPQIIGSTPALVDSTGVGDPIVESLASRYPNIEGFKFTASSKQELMVELAAAIQTWKVRFPEGVISNQLESFEYDIRPGGGIRYSAPSGLHDDAVMALALAVRHMRVGVVRSRFAYSIIETGGNFGYDD